MLYRYGAKMCIRDRLDAEVLASNRSMLAVFSRSGLPMKTERLDDVVLVTLALGA